MSHCLIIVVNAIFVLVHFHKDFHECYLTGLTFAFCSKRNSNYPKGNVLFLTS